MTSNTFLSTSQLKGNDYWCDIKNTSPRVSARKWHQHLISWTETQVLEMILKNTSTFLDFLVLMSQFNSPLLLMASNHADTFGYIWPGFEVSVSEISASTKIQCSEHWEKSLGNQQQCVIQNSRPKDTVPKQNVDDAFFVVYLRHWLCISTLVIYFVNVVFNNCNCVVEEAEIS